MERDILINEIANFCLDYGVIIDRIEIKSKIEDGLGKAELIESLINTIFIKAKNGKIKDIEKVKELLVELEKIRLDLEFKDYSLGQKEKRTKSLTDL